MQSSDGEAEVLVLSTADVDMTVHDGESVRVEGALDMSSSSGVKMLRLSAGRAVEETVLLCHQPVHRRSLAHIPGTFHQHERARGFKDNYN